MFKTLLGSTSYKIGLIFGCRIIAAAIGVFFLPIYIRYLGAESYGLVAFYSTISAALTLLVLGLSSSSTREFAVLRAKNARPERMASLLLSIEVLYWGIVMCLGVLIIMLSPFIAGHWVNTKELDSQVVLYCVMLMGGLFICQMPSSVYEGTLAGLQKQAQQELITLSTAIVKAVGVVFILKYVNSSIIAFFIWQAVITLLGTLILRIYAYRVISIKSVKKFFSRKMLLGIRRYSVGMTGIAVVTFFISGIDKVVVSKFLMLEVVGYYNIAFLLSNLLVMISAPIHKIALPKFNELEAKNKFDELRSLYYKYNRWVIVLVMPAGLALAVFAPDILFLWTKNGKIALVTAPILRVASLGAIMNSIASTFYSYTLAKGNTRFGLYQNLFSLLVILPLIFVLTIKYGAVGAASCTLIYNALLLSVSLPIFHSIYMKGEYIFWLKNILSVPVCVAIIVFVGGRYIQKLYYPDLNLIQLMGINLLLFTLYAFLITDTRTSLLLIYNKIIRHGKEMSRTGDS
ncbi:oligosaccharide flippase family protein [Niabella pedocola]|uniref:Oligosaccharide flippase family protein n=1 Tax=Niabella pedocola TaxID=1752077 RepID=A0ABS8PVT5_9BACT|nr:oligosaccharide flippase family protein [Niabella pedocola]MCD2425188.1 oligosaccharide flippase family protein [Niabella pedocola]